MTAMCSATRPCQSRRGYCDDGSGLPGPRSGAAAWFEFDGCDWYLGINPINSTRQELTLNVTHCPWCGGLLVAGDVESAAFGDELTHLRAEVERLKALLNTPHTADFLEAVKVEAAHQRERWGDNHDRAKEPQDWFWTLGYLAGKAIRPDGKRLHHIITSAALLLNWHAHESGVQR